MRMCGNIPIYDWWEIPQMAGVKELLDKTFPGWKIDGPYCPGKPWHSTFKATLGDEKKIVHVHDTTKVITVEEIVDYKTYTDSLVGKPLP